MIGTKINSAWPIESMTLRAYCKCGGAIHMTINKPGYELVMDVFRDNHSRPECGPCDAKTARKERARLERAGR